MRRYDDPVDVRRGMVGEPGRQVEAPEQFLWRGKLWKVRAVVAHWVETGPWWQSSRARTLVGTDGDEMLGRPNVRPGASAGASASDRALSVAGAGLLSEQEMWRVEAGCGMGTGAHTGVFDLSFSWADGTWQLLGCAD